MHASRLGSAARLAAPLCVLAGAPALAAGSASDGHALAQAWCSSCHMVDPSGQGPDTAPPFATIAARNPGDNGWLRAWLASPHPPMPNLGLSRQQIDDIVAYLNSLAPH
jgi:mono/diheme cytochrome c family protein